MRLATQAFADATPMRRDTIFRISSMTKPIIAVATMILVEECRLRLDEPVERWLPELADRQVLKRLDGPLDDTVPANRPITVRDLLTFRMGFGQMMALARRVSDPARRPTSSRLAWGRRVRRACPRRMSGCAAWGAFRSCTSRASGGCTTRAPTCWAC